MQKYFHIACIQSAIFLQIFAMLRSTETKLHMQLCSPEDDNSKVSIELDKSKGKLGLCIEQADDGKPCHSLTNVSLI